MQKHKSKGISPKELVRKFNEYRANRSDVFERIHDFFIAIDSPVSLSCYLLCKYGEWDQLVEKELSPFDYLDGETFRSDFAAISFLRKMSGLPTSYETRKVALDSFLKNERANEDTNRRWTDPESFLATLTEKEVRVIKTARRKIRLILRKFDIDRVLDLCTWGPGSTLLVTGESVSSVHKFDHETQMTNDACDLFREVLLRAYPTWENLKKIQPVVGNKVITVPKNAKTDRTIAIEPGLNIWVQLGIGKLIRERLRAFGFDLNSDAKNQRLALKGSRDGTVATLDFRAASDSITTQVVKFLLPAEWFSVLDSARSHYYTLAGEVFFSQKFSTMGNGFTFELESLIFLSVALASNEVEGTDSDLTSVFGDDLTVAVDSVPIVRQCCGHLGFVLNDQKSFSTGLFRESCGAYYFNGLDVKPIFLKRVPQRAKDLYRFANAIRYLSYRWGEPLGCDRRFKGIWSRLTHMVPHELRLYGPMSSGDSTIHDNNIHGAQRCGGQLEGYYYSSFPTQSIHSERESHGLLLTRLLRPSDEAQNNRVPYRGRTKTAYKKRTFVYQWHNFGEWSSFR